MVRLEVIHWLLEEFVPQVLAHKLNAVQLLDEARLLATMHFTKLLPDLIADRRECGARMLMRRNASCICICFCFCLCISLTQVPYPLRMLFRTLFIPIQYHAHNMY